MHFEHLRQDFGQSMIEYALLVGLLVFGAVVGLFAVGAAVDGLLVQTGAVLHKVMLAGTPPQVNLDAPELIPDMPPREHKPPVIVPEPPAAPDLSIASGLSGKPGKPIAPGRSDIPGRPVAPGQLIAPVEPDVVKNPS